MSKARPKTSARDTAEELIAAYQGAPLDPLGLDLAAAHLVRDCALEMWTTDGRVLAGRKIGLTAQTVRAKLGAPEPSDGFLFEDMRIANGGTVDARSLHFPLVEAELAILIGADIAHPGPDPESLLESVEGACAAIEIVDTRITEWKITYADAIADNGSAALFALSDIVVPFAGRTMLSWRTRVSGHQDLGQAGTRDAGEILSDLYWLAVKAARTGRPLRAGEIILTGALAGVTPVQAGDGFSVSVDDFGQCAVAFQSETSSIFKTAVTGPRGAPERS